MGQIIQSSRKIARLKHVDFEVAPDEGIKLPAKAYTSFEIKLSLTKSIVLDGDLLGICHKSWKPGVS